MAVDIIGFEALSVVSFYIYNFFSYSDPKPSCYFLRAWTETIYRSLRSVNEKIIEVRTRHFAIKVWMKYIFRTFAGKRLGDCKAYIVISIFCSEISRTLLSGRHKFLVSFTKINTEFISDFVCSTHNWLPFYSIQNIDVGTNEIGLELILGYDSI